VAICDHALVTDPAIDPEATLDAGAEPAIHVVYQLSGADYRSATIELTQQSVGTVAFGTVFVGMAVIPLLNGDLSSIPVLVFGLSLLTGVYCLPFIWWAIRRRSDLMLSRHDLTADEIGIRVATPTTTTQQTWSTFRRVRELTDVFTLDYGTGANGMVPKRALDAATAERFRIVVRSVGLLEQPPRWGNFVRGIGLGALLAVAVVIAIIIVASLQS
jgi:YcxB-like protein